MRTRRAAKLAILGSGRMGHALGGMATRMGYDVLYGSSSPGVRGCVNYVTYNAAVNECDFAALTTPWEHTQRALEVAGPFDNKVLIDATNPESADGRGLMIGHTTSGAELVSQWAQTARVVKAFNHVYAELLQPYKSQFNQTAASVLYCGDDSDAKSDVARFIRDTRFAPIDAGDLRSARYLEPLALLMVQLVRGQGLGPEMVAFKLLLRHESAAEVSTGGPL